MMEYNSPSDQQNKVEISAEYEEYAEHYAQIQDNQPSFLEAKIVYILMPKNIPISRAKRLQWLLDHLNTIITVPSNLKNIENSESLEIISVLPRDQTYIKCNRFRITYHTEVKFFAHSYRFVYCLDMSPSQSIIDLQRGDVLFDEILTSFKKSLEALCQTFRMPNSLIKYQPNIFITVMVNTPFVMTPAQQVLVKGVQLSLDNLADIIDYIEEQFHILENKIADVVALALDQIELQTIQNERIVGGLFDLPESEKLFSKISMVTPDVNFVNMLRYSMLAIPLLPENSLSHILVITDGIVAVPDSNIMESLLFQLHYDSVAVSFLKVGSVFHPHSSAGYVSYVDLLYFFAHSTLGTCLENIPSLNDEPSVSMNIYHELFMLWSFHSINKYTYPKCHDNKWNSSHKPPSLLSKRQTDENTSASLLLLLSRRMREGFTVDSLSLINGNLEIKLSLQWKTFIYILYKVSSQWPVIKNHTRFEVYITAPYEFLHDITCMIKKDKSIYRQAIIERFWSRITQLSSGDLGLAQQISSFQFNKDWYTLPESVRIGIPVYVLNNTSTSDNTKLMLIPRDSCRDTSCLKFVTIWQPICQMETCNWRRWLHVHKVSLILKHDNPLPKYLHLPNSSSKRYQVIQCRQAATALYKMLAEWATFILIDNHTYLRLLYTEKDKPPLYFCIIRVTSKFPCAVLNIGFTTSTPGEIRFKMCEELKSELSTLSYLASSAKSNENICCVLLEKPLEKILIRYDRVPHNYTTMIFPDGTQPNESAFFITSTTCSLFTTLSRYLYHKRWIWSTSHGSNLKLSQQAIARILETVTRMRLKEGFSFVHSLSGIITMVLELTMDSNSSCLIQYVLFPPHCAYWYTDGSCSGSEEETEYESDMQIVTEIWIEPQYGRVKGQYPRVKYLENKQYYEIADEIRRIDLQCISALLTVEHLSLMCQDTRRGKDTLNDTYYQTNWDINQKLVNNKINFVETAKLSEKRSHLYYALSARIDNISFKFDPISLLPLCQKIELIFSMFIEDKLNEINEPVTPNKLLLENILEHLILLNDDELKLSEFESERFTSQIISKHDNSNLLNATGNGTQPQWRCFVKGISVTHVILTFVPSTISDLKQLLTMKCDFNSCTNSGHLVDEERTPSRESNYSDVPINVSNNVFLPIYVFDCSLALIVNSFVQDNSAVSKYDICEDHRFKPIEDDFEEEECIRLKDNTSKLETKFNSYDSSDTSTIRRHCKALILAHSKCFTVTQFVSLHLGLHIDNYDVQSVMDLCEESITEIDITDYITTVCAHVKACSEDKILVKYLNQPMPCSDLRPLHSLIKDKFFDIIGSSFHPIPTNSDFYYYRSHPSVENDVNDSDDEISFPQVSDSFKSENFFNYNQRPPMIRPESVSDIQTESSPLFLHLICTVKFNADGTESKLDSGHINKSIRVLPTCLGELIHISDTKATSIDTSKMRITLDILCLTLPHEVQNIIGDYSNQGLRTTSFCSDGFQPSVGGSSISDASFISDVPEPLMNLPEVQKRSITILRDEIKWLLKDEIATYLLDIEPVTQETLNFVMQHVTEGSPFRSSCILDKIDLNFVYLTSNSYEKFVQEFAKIQLRSYKLYKKGDLYYLGKNPNASEEAAYPNYIPIEQSNSLFNENLQFYNNHDGSNVNISNLFDTASDKNTECDYNHKEEIGSFLSDVSSKNDSVMDTDNGYDEDISEDSEEYDWLENLNKKRQHLPNFWLITKVDNDVVSIYFHCRFLELTTTHVDLYLKVQKSVCDGIKNLCKKVNQILLLQSLYETRSCNPLLEQDDSCSDCHNDCLTTRPGDPSFGRLKSVEDTNEENDTSAMSDSLSEASQHFKAGHFRCAVVWEGAFDLNPRLRIGPGKSGISRGILALKTILDKFSVSNRNNMFVYRDKNLNVFYLRLHENVHHPNKSANQRPNEFENILVSRSPSIASLPIGQKNNLHQSEQSIASISATDIRPRVRSFGEKESQVAPHEDTIVLKVHGITEAGDDVRLELVQVLQNRLDDAVLEFLSVMLSRNALCPLTPSDVQFIQKPFKTPEYIIKLSIPEFALQTIDAFIHYLKQNLLQFLNVPKYTDSRTHFHFKDYPGNDDCSNKIKDNIFVYNQSQNPSSGNRGIACIALALTYNCVKIHPCNLNVQFAQIFSTRNYTSAVDSRYLNDEEATDNYLEFRLWTQGRVNYDNLSQKLKSAVRQASWDIVIEYYLLILPLCEPTTLEPIFKNSPIEINKLNLNLSHEIEFNCVLDLNVEKNVKKEVTNNLKRKINTDILPRKRNRRVIPPNSKVSRSITFENYEKEKEIMLLRKKQPATQQQPPPQRSINTSNSYETGDEGKLSEIYSKHLPDWLEFGNTLNAPAVRKHMINITPYLTKVVIREIFNLLRHGHGTAKAFQEIYTNCLNTIDNEIFLPYTQNNFTNSRNKYVIILRDFDQWKASINSECSENHNLQNLKHTQKFIPTYTNHIYIPRQKIIWVLIDTDSVTFYSYNWAKDHIEKLISDITNLGLWLCVRSCFLNSVTLQKMGLFHNQPLTRKCYMLGSNPYINSIGDTDHIKDFSRDTTRKRQPTNLLSILEAFRDNFRNSKYTTWDPVVVFTIEMREMKALEKKSKDEMKVLHAMYQSRTSTTTVPHIFLLMQNSRIIHYCHTPLLFLPRWRLRAAATRDHSLYPLQNKITSEENEVWHKELCYSFFFEYRNYLQTLGFIPLQFDNAIGKTGMWAKDDSSYNSVFYIQKTILGGILLFTVEFREPFFISKLHAIECSRLQNISSRASINRFTLSFLDECDRVKIFMHLHSFTYDYHLRCIYNYISKTQGVNTVCDRYNVHQFLDDFLKYYYKAPNFARNLVHTDTITIPNLVTEGKELYEYLLLNVDQYNFKVLEMDLYENESIEYILIQVTSTPPVSYKDSQDRQHTNDFDITLIVYNLCTPYKPSDDVLHLKYYLILTSKTEIYPKSEIEHKLGKFRTVSKSHAPDKFLHETETEKIDNNSITTESESDCEQICQSTSTLEDEEPKERQPQITVGSHIEIFQESVNYLGYYSSHEQLMQQLILDKANTTQKNIKGMVKKGMVDCRTHLLWNRLVSSQGNILNYDEFMELKGLAKLSHLCDLRPSLSSLLNQSLNWYQGLSKLVLVKYVEHHRTFFSSDGNIQHYVILHPQFFGAFILLSIDLHTSRGDIYAVQRDNAKQKESDSVCTAYQKSLLDDFVNCICFYLWSGMI